MKVIDYFREGIRYNLITTEEDNGLDIISDFMAWAIQNKKKCIYFAHELNYEILNNHLNNYNLDLIELIKSNKLVLGSEDEYFIRENFTRYTNVIRLIKNALEEGFSGVAIIADRDSNFEKGITEEELYCHEKLLDEIVSSYPVTAVSCYNIDRFGVDAIFALAHFNPNFIYKSDRDSYFHDEKEIIFSQKETLEIVYNFLKNREFVKRQNKVYQFISKLSVELSYKKDENDIIETSLGIICNAGYADYGFVIMADNGRVDNKNIITHNISDEMMDMYLNKIYPAMEGMADILKKLKCMIHTLDDLDNEKRSFFEKYNIQSFIHVPLRFDSEIYGYMWLGTRDKNISFGDTPDFLYKVCATITKIVAEYRRYKKMQDSLMQSRKIKALGELTGGIAHEFNNILTPIMGYIGILKDKVNDPVLLRYIDMIENSARDGSKIVKRIQDFSRNRKREKELVDIDRAIIQSVEITKPKWTLESQIKQKFINVKLDLKSEALVLGVSTEIREIFINLISNSIDAMPKGGKISISSYADDGKVVIRVKDTGSGMEKEVVEKIFEPFFTTKNETGNGLGLSIVYNIVKEMGGDIEVQSTLNEGTEFIISLPIKSGSIDYGTSSKQALKTQGIKIMVVDDQVAVAEAVADMLTAVGHEVVKAGRSGEAIEYYKEQDFDCVLCDLAMPDYSGCQLSAIFKEIKPDIPFVLMTGWPGSLKTNDLKHVDEILQKPFSVEEVNETILKAVGKQVIKP